MEIVRVADVALVHRPWPRQGMINDGDLVVKEIRVRWIGTDPLLDDRLVVEGKRQAGGIVDARTSEGSPGLHFKEVVDPGAGFIDPAPNRVSRIARLDLAAPLASIGENAPERA